MASTIDNTKPLTNSLITSAELRALATAAKNDIETLQGQIGGSGFVDNTFNIVDNIDNTKSFNFQLDGQSASTQATIVTTHTASRIYTLPNYSMTFAGLVSNYLVLEGTSSSGVKVGGTTPRLGSADLRGHFVVDSSGVNAPVMSTFDTGIEFLGYNASDISRWGYHVEHRDVVGGTKSLHLHIKKARGSTVAAGTNLVISAVILHSYHNFDGQTPRGASPAPITLTFTITPAQLNAIPDGSTGIFQQDAFNAGGTGGLLNSNNLFIDDDIAVQLTVTSLPTITGGATARIAIPHADFHREVNDGSGTYNADDIGGSFYK